MTPSIKDQTPWKVGFFDFGKAQTPDTRFFNPALIQHQGSDWLIARKASPIPWHNLGQNSLVAFRLNKDHKPEAFVEINLKNRNYKDQHWEDPRIVRINNSLVLSYCTFQIYRGGTYSGAHQQVAFLNDGMQPIETWDPIYGGNGGSILMQSGNEKNWMWFAHDGSLHFVYMVHPHTVVETDGVRIVHQHRTDFSSVWKYGELRGGTNPVRIGDEYLAFFHSSVPWKHVPKYGERRRYFMGAYTFEAQAPFRVKRMTPTPLLTGSEFDPQIPGSPAVVFPCGLVIEPSGTLYCTYGVNDCASGWVRMQIADIESRMVQC